MLEFLIKDWLAQDFTLSKHFSVFIDEGVKKNVPNWAVIRSSIDVVCRRSTAARAHQRYLGHREIFQRPIAFIDVDRITLNCGHRIGRKKNAEIMSSDPEFFTHLKDVMLLMHKVEFGKTCELKPADL